MPRKKLNASTPRVVQMKLMQRRRSKCVDVGLNEVLIESQMQGTPLKQYLSNLFKDEYSAFEDIAFMLNCGNSQDIKAKL